MTFQISDFRFQIAGAVLASVLTAAPNAEVIDRVLAVVSGDLILLTDVNAAREFGLVPIEGTAADPSNEILSRLIDRALVLAEVERFAPPEPESAAVDAEIQRIRARFPSPPLFAEALARVGIDERHLRETLRQELRIAAYLNQRFTIVPPSEAELGRYYREHAEQFMRNGAVQAFESVRQEVVEAATRDGRRVVVDEWLAGLRRRADIRQLSP
jgi:hypothetical protein